MGPFISSGRPKRDSDVASDPAMDSRMNPRRHDGEARVVEQMQRDGGQHAAEAFAKVTEHQRRHRDGESPAGRLGREVQRDEGGGRPEICLRDGTEFRADVRCSRLPWITPRNTSSSAIGRRATKDSQALQPSTAVACVHPVSGPARTAPGRRPARQPRSADRRARPTSPVGAGPGRSPRARERPADCRDRFDMARSSHANRSVDDRCAERLDRRGARRVQVEADTSTPMPRAF